MHQREQSWPVVSQPIFTTSERTVKNYTVADAVKFADTRLKAAGYPVVSKVLVSALHLDVRLTLEEANSFADDLVYVEQDARNA